MLAGYLVLLFVSGQCRMSYTLRSQRCPAGERCLKADTSYTDTMPVITIAVINERLKEALQGASVSSQINQGPLLTSKLG